ncbi:MAG: ATP-dependent DNA helicase RecG [Synergistaceae bacterium]|nr:ATP-dependent DNA helicase RecG [Synergistaceae bacterium]
MTDVLSLESDVRFLRGVGPARARLLERLSVRTVRDLLYLFPRRYEDRRTLTALDQLKPGTTASVVARVVTVERRSTRRPGLTLIRALITDGRGYGYALWFNRRGLENLLPPGTEASFYGTIETHGGKLQITNPEVEVLQEGESDSLGRIIPVYPLTEGLSPLWLRRLIGTLLPQVLPSLEDTLPETIRDRLSLLPLPEAVEGLHYPRDGEHWRSCRRRIAFQELFVLQLGLALRRHQARKGNVAFPLVPKGPLSRALIESLPFPLTDAQRRVIDEIGADLVLTEPMNRLLQGDVGSGKTVVAALALVAAVDGGCQAAFMVPTEVLALQHHRRLSELLEPLGLEVVLIRGAMTARERQENLLSLREGRGVIAVGTHALIEDPVLFRRLGLVVIDEQHRFGVLQRGALAAKGRAPHVLVMTATPIPRTLTVSIYGDLAVSVLDELPPGRRPVVTRRVPSRRRRDLLNFIGGEMGRGRQVYWVCPLVEESETLDVASSQGRHDELTAVFPDRRVGLLHGQMASRDKEAVLLAFQRGEIDLLVSTTVIEVGVDVANATVMVIEDAHRFGLSQLHQLRGRVGRGGEESYCLLLSEGASAEGRKRLDALCSTQDGFRIAEIDLRLRGPGEVCGIRQHGLTDFRVADLLRDGKILGEARREAQALVASDPSLAGCPELRKELFALYGERLELAVTG